MAKHKVEVITPEHFGNQELTVLKRAFKSTTAGVLKRRRSKAFDPSVDNVETTIRRRRRRAKSAAKKARKEKKK